MKVENNEDEMASRIKRFIEDERLKEDSDLRDRFAMAALQGIMNWGHNIGRDDNETYQHARARRAYEQADAMMIARTK